MAGSDRKPGDPYEVGFARPPKDSRWKKGQSGNRRGRPKKPLHLMSELRAVLVEKIDLTVDGRPVKMTMQRAIMLRLRTSALGGEVWAQKLHARIMDEAPPPAAAPYARELEEFKAVLVAEQIGKLLTLTPSVEVADGE